MNFHVMSELAIISSCCGPSVCLSHSSFFLKCCWCCSVCKRWTASECVSIVYCIAAMYLLFIVTGSVQQGVHIKAVCQRDIGVSVELILISDMEMGRRWHSDKCFTAAGETCWVLNRFVFLHQKIRRENKRSDSYICFHLLAVLVTLCGHLCKQGFSNILMPRTHYKMIHLCGTVESRSIYFHVKKYIYTVQSEYMHTNMQDRFF